MSDTIENTQERIKKYTFYKYRESWSSKITEWKTVRLPEGYDAKGYFDDLSASHSWSEHFHGIEYKKCKPSITWSETEILKLRNRASEITQLADDLCWILEYYEQEKVDRVRSRRKNRRAR